MESSKEVLCGTRLGRSISFDHIPGVVLLTYLLLGSHDAVPEKTQLCFSGPGSLV